MNLRAVSATAAVLMLAACSSSAAKPQPMVTVNGTVTLHDIASALDSYNYALPCHGVGGYKDLTTGAEVVISSDSGATLASRSSRGKVVNSDAPAGTCSLTFTASVRGGLKFYGIEVTHRGVTKSPEAQLGSAALTIGN